MSWALRNTLWASVFVIIPYIYIAFRLYYSAKFLYPQQARKSKYIIWITVAWLNFFPLIMLFLYFRDTLLDELVYKNQTTMLDYFFLFPFWMGLIIIVEILPYFLAAELLQLVITLFFSSLKETFRKWAAIARLTLAGFFIAFVVGTTLSDTYTVRESAFELKIDNLPDALDNLDLTLLADLQVDRFTQHNKTDKVREIINSNQTDLLFFAGDLVTRGTEFINQGIETMCDLQAGTERLACIGDHDHWADGQKIAAGLDSCGWTFLYNAHRIIPYKDKKILVTGITYIYSQRTSPEQLDSLLKSAPQADLKIMLVHQPSKVALKYADLYSYDIFLAGHTHGGQVVFSPFGFTITPTKFENVFYSGYYKQNNMNIFVTNGVGLTMMPLRYGAPAEVIRVTLKK